MLELVQMELFAKEKMSPEHEQIVNIWEKYFCFAIHAKIAVRICT